LSDEPPQEPVFHYIAHTHWEGAVFKTRAEYLDIGLPNILRALRLLDSHPDYRFTLDQAAYIGPFLQRYPYERPVFQRFVDDGRLAVVGGTHVMPDVNMPGGESFVRQLLLGKGFCRRELGVDVRTGWLLDTFGHHAQLPQLLRLAGIGSLWFMRGVPSWETPAEFFWEGLDGSRVEAYWLPQTYAVAYGSPADAEGFARFMAERFAALAPQAAGPDRAGPAGADVSAPEAHVPTAAAAFNRRPDRSFRLRLSVPAEFEAAVRQRGPERPVVTGELNPIFPGTYSSRIDLKQRLRVVEGQLAAAEELGAILRWLGAQVATEPLWEAWEPVLFNQAHDLMSGVMTDAVYADTVRGYEFAQRRVAATIADWLEQLAAHVDTRGPGLPLLVFNPLGWERTDAVKATVGCGSCVATGLELIDAEGHPVPLQLVRTERHDDGTLLAAEVVFVATGVPALGYAVYWLVPVAGEQPPADGAVAGASAVSSPAAGGSEANASASGAGVCLGNEYLQLRLDPRSGALVSLRATDEGRELLAGPANVVAIEEDRGDLWELYHPLDAAQRVAARAPQPPPARGSATFSADLQGEPGRVRRGRVFDEFELAPVALGAAQFGTRVRVYAGLRRVDIRTTLVNQARGVRYRALFPTTLAAAAATHEIPFGAIARPAGSEFPAQNWIDCSDGEHGIALLNRGLPGNGVADGTMMLSLLRATSIVAYGYGGGYEPGMSSDSAQELGVEHVLEYSLVPHRGDWRQATVWRHGWELNRPLLAHATDAHRGPLPPRWGLLDVSAAHVVVSAVKPGEDGGIVLRLYEAAGQPAPGALVRLAGRVAAAAETDLLEGGGLPCPVSAGEVLHLDFRPFEIKTIRLERATGGAARSAAGRPEDHP